jgi:hypothetical protein
LPVVLELELPEPLGVVVVEPEPELEPPEPVLPELDEPDGVLPLAPIVPVPELLLGVLDEPLEAVSELLLPLVDGVVALPLAPIVEREVLVSAAVLLLLLAPAPAPAPAVVSFAPRLHPARPRAQAATMAAAVLRVMREAFMSVLLGLVWTEMERRRNGSPCCLRPTLGGWCERAVVSCRRWV